MYALLLLGPSNDPPIEFDTGRGVRDVDGILPLPQIILYLLELRLINVLNSPFRLTSSLYLF